MPEGKRITRIVGRETGSEPRSGMPSTTEDFAACLLRHERRLHEADELAGELGGLYCDVVAVALTGRKRRQLVVAVGEYLQRDAPRRPVPAFAPEWFVALRVRQDSFGRAFWHSAQEAGVRLCCVRATNRKSEPLASWRARLLATESAR